MTMFRHRSVLAVSAKPPRPPLDAAGVSALACYGVRKLRQAYTGAAVRIRRSSDNVEANIGFTPNGDFDVAAYNAHVAGGTGYVVTRFDQSGNSNDVTQATTTKQATLVLAVRNGKPVIRYDGADDFHEAGDNAGLSPTAALTIVIAGSNSGAGTGNRVMLLKNGNTAAAQGAYGLIEATDGSLRMGLNVGGWADRAVSSAGILVDNTWYLYEGVYGGATAKTYVNTSEVGTTTLSGSVADTTGTLSVGGYNASFSAQEYYKGDLPEVYLFGSLAASARSILDANVRLYWAI